MTFDPAAQPLSFTVIEDELQRRWPESQIEPSLDRIRQLVGLLGEPQRAYPVIHVAGTNGKTSTVRMIDSLLRSFGLRVGRYTSPHLATMRERIVMDDEPLTEAQFVTAYLDIAPYLDLVDDAFPDARLSFFEVMTAMAFATFADAPVDVAVIEVGLGGSWDATNVADGQVAVVTPIALDHQAYLGHDVATIAGEKAGIVKAGSAAVFALQAPEAAEVLGRRAAELAVVTAVEGRHFGIRHRDIAVGGQMLVLQGLGGLYEDVFLPLHGRHQAHNAAVALAAVESFLGGGQGMLDVDAVRAGFAAVRSPGRLEVVRRGPTILLDAAHNPHGAAALADALADSFTFSNLVGVVAVLADKDARSLLEALEPVLHEVVVTTNSSPRALPAEQLAEIAREVFGDDRVHVVARLDGAIEAAVELIDADSASTMGGGGVVVTGSVVTAGDARTLLAQDA